MQSTMAGTKKSLSYYTSRGLSYVIFVGWTIMTIAPLLWLFYSSFKTKGEIIKEVFALPTVLHFDNYARAWIQADLGVLFMSSTLYVIFATAGVLMLSMMASYAFAKMRYKKTSNVLFGLIGLGLLITVQAILIPLFIMFKEVGISSTALGQRIGLTLTYIALGLPMGIYLGTEYMRGLPDSLVESAYMDGASNTRMFLNIILPMTMPVLVTLGIMNILGTWNEFMLASVLTSNNWAKTVPYGVFSFASPTQTQYDLQFAALVIAVLPVVIIFGLFNKRITQGVVGGAVKG